ncbi:MAG TPA: ribosome biogenesis GTPase Der [Vicinamibacterales bacterium]|nr:ribosome biogenesis GTPase Der [Vicinamibacterales bacterium]
MALKRAGAGATVVLVGRPNVGKSTLFNRVTRSRRSIVTSIAGTTRDVIAQPVDWEGTAFTLVDTGGMFGASTDPLHESVFEHGRRAIAAADVLVFVVDGRDGLVPADQEIAATLRQATAPVIVAVNKTDDRRARGRALEFYEMGFEPVFEIAAEHGDGVGDMLEEVVRRLPARRDGRLAETEEETKVAIVGRPNVGKSSLLNRLLREERAIVSDVPGTTRDTVDALLKWHKRAFRIVDTAGIRRPGRVARSGQLESLSVVVARRAIEKADVAVLVIDATEGATDQDAAIAGEADAAGCGIIIAANKWDLVKGRGADFSKTFDEDVRRQLKFLDYASILHLSASTGERTPKLLEAIDRVAAARQKRIPTAELNRFVQAITAVHPPASPGRREVRILYAAQTGVAPPAFVFFTNVATSFHFSYERFLVNRLRESFGLMGTPVRVHVRRREK